MAYCVGCTKAVRDEDRFCPFCGNDRGEGAGQASPRAATEPIKARGARRARGWFASVPVGGVVVVAIVGFIIYTSMTDSGDKAHSNTAGSASNASASTITTEPTLGAKLRRGKGLSPAERSALKTFYRSDQDFIATANGVIDTFNDPTQSVDGYLAKIDEAQGALLADLDSINQSTATITDQDVHPFLVPLPGAMSQQIQGINAIAEALRSGSSTRFKTGRQTLNDGIRQTRAFEVSRQQQMKTG